MSIQGIILDLSNTTFNPDGSIQDGIEDLLSFCRENNLSIAFTTNENIYKVLLLRSSLEYDLLVTPNEVNLKKKPSPKFIEYIETILNIPKDKFIYIGDNDFTDAICASHAKVLYFSARWANPNPQYGIPVSNPSSVIRIIRRHLLKEEYWGWELEKIDNQERPIKAIALLDCRSSLRDYAVRALKYGERQHRTFFLLHLVSSVYLSGLYREVDYWATYPSHNEGNSLNPLMSWIFDRVTKEFRKKYIDLFYRHKESIDSGTSRRNGISVNFTNQISTVVLNQEYRRKIRRKKILVVDDFITEGYSLECARNLLYQANVSDVIGLSIGKYGNRYIQISIRNSFDPFNPVDISRLVWDERILRGQIFASVQDILEDSLNI